MSTYRYNFLFVNTTTLLLATGYFCSLEFLYQSEQTILLGFFWLLFFCEVVSGMVGLVIMACCQLGRIVQ